jgi:hypothetical protein
MFLCCFETAVAMVVGDVVNDLCLVGFAVNFDSMTIIKCGNL